MARENYLLRLSMLEQESNKIEQQVNIINQQIVELQALQLSLEKLDNVEKGKMQEILAPLGRGIFVKSEMKEKELFVNIGGGVVVKKKTKEAVEIIQKQIEQLDEIKGNLIRQIGEINLQLQSLVEEAREEES